MENPECRTCGRQHDIFQPCDIRDLNKAEPDTPSAGSACCIAESSIVVGILVEIARKAHFLADDTCEQDGVLTVDAGSFNDLCYALDKLDALPEPGPNLMASTGAAKAKAFLAI